MSSSNLVKKEAKHLTFFITLTMNRSIILALDYACDTSLIFICPHNLLKLFCNNYNELMLLMFGIFLWSSCHQGCVLLHLVSFYLGYRCQMELTHHSVVDFKAHPGTSFLFLLQKILGDICNR